MEGNQKQIGIAVLCLAVLGGIGAWWMSVGRFEASLECKAAKAQLADLKVGVTTEGYFASVKGSYYGMAILKTEQAVTRYCKGSL